MKKKLLNLFFLLVPLSLYTQVDQSFPVYLIGDVGEYTSPGKAMIMLKEELLLHPNSTVIFLGDNIYPSGLKTNDRKSTECLESQLQILKEYKGQAYFIPGNHDWQAQGMKGLKRLKNQQEYVNVYLKNNCALSNKSNPVFLPENGLPGPATAMLNNKLRLITIDTQWFLHFYKKNKTGTKSNTKKIFYARLDSLLNLAKQNQEQVIIAAHHPLFSNGLHSKSKQPLRFLVNYTPCQILGLIGLNRLLSQDLPQPRYKKMRIKMLESFDQYDNIIYAAGHEHNLQCFKHGPNRYLVSGAGSKLTPLRKKKRDHPVFQDDTRTGFIKIAYAADGSHTTTIYRVNEVPKLIEGY